MVHTSVLPIPPVQRISRISYNSANWQRPTGEAQQSESSDTFNARHGFGYEDWLFRNEWVIDGWRYAFVQGVSKSRQKLVSDSQPFELTLFTIDPQKRRRYVAAIHDVECLGDQQAQDAFTAYKRLGWYQTMRGEISVVGGDIAEFDASVVPWNFVNVRFRVANVEFASPNRFAKPNDPIFGYDRYMLYHGPRGIHSGAAAVRQRHGASNTPVALPYHRAASPAVQCTPEHTRMQAMLMEELRRENPSAKVVREQAFVDVRVTTKTEIILYEIKTALQPGLAIREALGQILEYAYHPARKYQLPVRLVIVGRRSLAEADEQYLERLRTEFQLPLSYRVVAV